MRGGWTVAAVGFGIAASLLANAPLAFHASEAIVTHSVDCGKAGCADSLLHLWIVGEAGRRLVHHPLSVFDANIFHPLHHALAFSDAALAMAAGALPVTALTGNPIVGFNCAYLSTAAVSFLGLFFLVRRITGDPRAALLAGLLFVMGPARWEFRGHVFALAMLWTPFILHATLRLADRPSMVRGLWLVLVVLLHFQSGAYFAIMLPFLLVPWVFVLAVFGPWPWSRWLVAGAVLVVAHGLGAFTFLPYATVREVLQMAPRPSYFPMSSRWYWGPYAHPIDYVRGWFAGPRGVGMDSPLPVVLLVLAALVTRLRPGRPPAPAERVHLAATLAFGFGSVLTSIGPEHPILFFLQTPLVWISRIPGVNSLRGAHRFVLLAALASTTVAGIAIARILRPLGRAQAAAVVAALVALVLLDGRLLREGVALTRMMTPANVPEHYRWLATTPPDTAILELPYGAWDKETRYMVASLYHGRRLMNGYSAIIPRYVELIERFPDAPTLASLADAGIAYVFVHEADFPRTPRGTAALQRMQEATLPQRRFGDTIVFTIPPAPPASPPVDPALPREAWRPLGDDPDLARAADGDLATHWTAGVDAERRFRIAFAHETIVSDIVVLLGRHVLEYPRGYAVSASLDGTTWEDIGGETVTHLPFASYRVDPERTELRLQMRPTRARSIEIRVPAGQALGAPAHWGIHELRVHGRIADATARSPRAGDVPDGQLGTGPLEQLEAGERGEIGVDRIVDGVAVLANAAAKLRDLTPTGPLDRRDEGAQIGGAGELVTAMIRQHDPSILRLPFLEIAHEELAQHPDQISLRIDDRYRAAGDQRVGMLGIVTANDLDGER